MRYEPINGWTKQGIIDRINVRNNGKQSLLDNREESCAYRGAGGNCCAVGCFIPDELYDPKMEGDRVFSILRTFPALEGCMPLPPMAMSKLQEIHDLDFGTQDDPRIALVDWVNRNVL